MAGLVSAWAGTHAAIGRSGLRPEAAWRPPSRLDGRASRHCGLSRRHTACASSFDGLGTRREREREKSVSYDYDNVFAKILRGEIPCKKVAENDHALAFHDIQPQTPTHVLVIPKGPYVSSDDFAANASDAEIAGFFRLLGQVARDLGVVEKGYRILANHGRDAHQEVPHFHMHIFAGKDLGRMIKPAEDGN